MKTTTAQTEIALSRKLASTKSAAFAIIRRLDSGHSTGRNLNGTKDALWRHVATLREVAIAAEDQGDQWTSDVAWSTMQTVERRALRLGARR